MNVNTKILGDFGGLCVLSSPTIQNYRSVTAFRIPLEKLALSGAI